MADPLLTSVALALPTKLQGVSHIVQYINQLLLPSTIEAAVHLNLQRVIKVFGATSTWTVAAMDGAAARGRLNLIKWLDTHRKTVGFSTAAFNGAAANNHLGVLYWLLKRYAAQCNLTEGLRKAAEAGQMDAVVMLVPKCEAFVVGEALCIAIFNEHATMVEFLLRNCQSTEMGSALVAATDKDLPEMLERILVKCGSYDGLNFRGKIFFRWCFISAASRGSAQIVKLLVNGIPVSGFPLQTIGSALLNAAENSKYEVVEIVLDAFKSREPRLPVVVVSPAFKKACARNDLEMVELLTKYCGKYVAGLSLPESCHEQGKKKQRHC